MSSSCLEMNTRAASFRGLCVIRSLTATLQTMRVLEDIVLVKLRWFELGNRISDKQWNDIVQVLEVQHGNLDEAYLIKWARHFNVLDLLREAQLQVVT